MIFRVAPTYSRYDEQLVEINLGTPQILQLYGEHIMPVGLFYQCIDM